MACAELVSNNWSNTAHIYTAACYHFTFSMMIQLCVFSSPVTVFTVFTMKCNTFSHKPPQPVEGDVIFCWIPSHIGSTDQLCRFLYCLPNFFLYSF